jgi:hypothetical protein
VRHRSKSRPLDGEGMRRRVEAALRKAERGEDLTKKELMIVQWVTRPGGCRACSTTVRVSRDGGADR